MNNNAAVRDGKGEKSTPSLLPEIWLRLSNTFTDAYTIHKIKDNTDII
jgi:hypothetical protein